MPALGIRSYTKSSQTDRGRADTSCDNGLTASACSLHSLRLFTWRAQTKRLVYKFCSRACITSNYVNDATRPFTCEAFLSLRLQRCDAPVKVEMCEMLDAVVFARWQRLELIFCWLRWAGLPLHSSTSSLWWFLSYMCAWWHPYGLACISWSLY